MIHPAHRLTPMISVVIVSFAATAALSQTAPVTGADLLKTDILAVLAHPDDETVMAATVARYALVEDKSVAHVYCTRGEGGGNMVGTQWGPALGILRERELRDCLAILGVGACYFLDQVDWAYTESASMTLEKWDHEAALERLTRIIRTLRPNVVLTMSPFPGPGWHGHHQAAGMLAVEATAAAADPERFPMQIKREGLTAWRTAKVYFRGSRGEAQPTTEASINTRFLLPGGISVQDTVRKALSNHRSQGFGRFSRGGGGLMPPETFVRLRSTVDNGRSEEDLFAGLDSAGTDWLTPPQSPGSLPDESQFEPRPAITNFLDWAGRNGVRHLTGVLDSDIPVVRGQTTLLKLRTANLGSGRLEFSASAPGVSVRGPKRLTDADQSVTVAVRVPEDQEQDFEVAATLLQGTSTAKFTATVHPVPSTEAATLPSNTAIDNDANWSSLPAVPISASQLVQGKAEGPEDCSATFRIAHDEQFFYVEVTVTDDTIVSNIAPNDIRGHWRSDSVEICIDPGGSEHTLTCFKLGIFPFDSAGNVRAARDADANQGPVEETSPDTQLFSQRLPDGGGYRIRTAIPLADANIKFSDTQPTTIGFNVIIYDGDKPDAAPGENINQARIAWSPRSGVQGRPEDWGRVTLKSAP